MRLGVGRGGIQGWIKKVLMEASLDSGWNILAMPPAGGPNPLWNWSLKLRHSHGLQSMRGQC